MTQRRVFLSEWTKLRSVRSTRYGLLAAVILTIGLAAVASTVMVTHWTGMRPAERANFNPLDASMVGLSFAQLAIGVLGVLVISTEYSTGMIRSSFSAVPRRLPVLWAKAGVFALGLGAIIRNTAGGIATFAGILFVLPGLMHVLPANWSDAISPYLPSNAGQQIMSLVRDPNMLSPWGGFALFCGWTVAVMGIAALLLVRRDT